MREPRGEWGSTGTEPQTGTLEKRTKKPHTVLILVSNTRDDGRRNRVTRQAPVEHETHPDVKDTREPLEDGICLVVDSRCRKKVIFVLYFTGFTLSSQAKV